MHFLVIVFKYCKSLFTLWLNECNQGHAVQASLEMWFFLTRRKEGRCGIVTALETSDVGLCVLGGPFYRNVNRMEGSGFMAGAGTLRLAFAWQRLSSSTPRVPVSS